MSICRRCNNKVNKYTTMFGYCESCCNVLDYETPLTFKTITDELYRIVNNDYISRVQYDEEINDLINIIQEDLDE